MLASTSKTGQCRIERTIWTLIVVNDNVATKLKPIRSETWKKKKKHVLKIDTIHVDYSLIFKFVSAVKNMGHYEIKKFGDFWTKQYSHLLMYYFCGYVNFVQIHPR